MNAPTPTLYLRTDGSIMFARGAHTIEMRLTAEQLLQLGLDCLEVAVKLAPAALPVAAQVLDSVVIPPHLIGPASQALAESTVTPDAACHKLN
jgi:hypothetical protein